MTNNKVNKRFISLIIGLTVLCVLVMVLYLSKFYGELSDEQADWGSFGSYFGGVIGSLATLSTLIWLVYIFVKQVEEQNKSREIERLEKQMENIKKELYSISKIKISPLQSLGLIQLIVKDSKVVEDVITRDGNLFLKYTDGSELLEPDRGLFSLLKLSFFKLGKDKTHKIFMEQNSLNLKQDILTFVANLNYFVLVVRELSNSGYEQKSIFYILSLFHSHVILLYKLGLVAESVYHEYLLLQSKPFKMCKNLIPIRSVVYDILLDKNDKYKKVKEKDLVVELPKYNDDKTTIFHEISIPSINESFRWELGNLSKI